jgi:hypothetical protein
MNLSDTLCLRAFVAKNHCALAPLRTLREKKHLFSVVFPIAVIASKTNFESQISSSLFVKFH